VKDVCVCYRTGNVVVPAQRCPVHGGLTRVGDPHFYLATCIDCGRQGGVHYLTCRFVPVQEIIDSACAPEVHATP
jgi:hypothetical protein